MQLEMVKHLSEVERLCYWIKEREQVRRSRALGLLPPWTDDPIISKYRFCNVRRMDDKVSCWLYDNWYLPYYNHPNMIAACFLARQLNNPDSLGAIGFPEKWRPDEVCKLLTARAKQGLRNFNAAYMITGTLGGTKIEQVVYKVVTPVYNRPPSLNTDSMQETAKVLLPLSGVSSFMSGQIVADLRHAVNGRWLDKHTWAPIGPGSRRGMNRLHKRPLLHPINPCTFVSELNGLIEVLKDRLSTTITKRLEAQDYQSCLCEWDKYERALWGHGKPKQLYRG